MKLELMDYGAVVPLVLLSIFAIGILIFDLFLSKDEKYLNGILSLIGFIVSLLSYYWLRDYHVIAFGGFFILDMLSIFFSILFCLIGGMTVLLSFNYLRIERVDKGEYYVLLMFATVGMMLLAGAGNLVMIFLGIETMSIPIYILAGFRRNKAQSVESALKYFLMGAFSTGFLLFGIALIYASTGTFSLQEIAAFRHDALSMEIFKVGIGMLIIGLGFKISAVPFHMWTPDVYQGAPTPVTGFMAVGVKAAGFAVLIRLFYIAFADIGVNWKWIIMTLSILTMLVGNISALSQKNIKRMLAYSSIAHAGYLLAALVPGTQEATAGILFYLIAYAIMNLGAFGCIILTSWRNAEGDELKDFRGMGWEKPVMGVILTIFMLSLAGIPPTAGFLGKFYIFSAIIKSQYYGLAVIGILNSLISVFYYLRVIVVMYMEPKEVEIHSDDTSIFARGAFVAGALLGSAALTIFLGLWPQYFYGAALRTLSDVFIKF